MYLNIFELTLIYQVISFIIIAACTSIVQWYARHKSNIDIKLSFESGWIDKLFGYNDYARRGDNTIAIILSIIVALLSLYPTFSNVVFKPREVYTVLNTSRYEISNGNSLGLIDMSSVDCNENVTECALNTICKNIVGCGLGYGLNNMTLHPSVYPWFSEVTTDADYGTIITPDQQVWTFGDIAFQSNYTPLLAGSSCVLSGVANAFDYLGGKARYINTYSENQTLQCIPLTQANVNVFIYLKGVRSGAKNVAYGDEHLTLSRPNIYRSSVSRRYVQTTELMCYTGYSCARGTIISAEIYGFSYDANFNLEMLCQQQSNFDDSKFLEICDMLLSLQEIPGKNTTVMQVINNSSNSIQFVAYSRTYSQGQYYFTIDYKNMTVISYYGIIHYNNTEDLTMVLAYNDSGVIYNTNGIMMMGSEHGNRYEVNGISGYFDVLANMNWFDGPLHNIIVDMAMNYNGSVLSSAAMFYKSEAGIFLDTNWVVYILSSFISFLLIKVVLMRILEPRWAKPLRTTLLSAVNISGPSTLDIVYANRIFLIVNDKYQLNTSQSDEIIPLTTTEPAV